MLTMVIQLIILTGPPGPGAGPGGGGTGPRDGPGAGPEAGLGPRLTCKDY